MSHSAHSLAYFIKVSSTCSLTSSHYTEERNKDYVLAFPLQQQTITSAREKLQRALLSVASSLLHATNEKTVYLPLHSHANYQTRPVPHADQVVPCMCCTVYSQLTCPLSNPDNLFGIGLFSIACEMGNCMSEFPVRYNYVLFKVVSAPGAETRNYHTGHTRNQTNFWKKVVGMIN